LENEFDHLQDPGLDQRMDKLAGGLNMTTENADLERLKKTENIM